MANSQLQLAFIKFYSIDGSTLQQSKPIDTTLSDALFQLPFVPADTLSSLAQRNLLRHLTKDPEGASPWILSMGLARTGIYSLTARKFSS
ncbi:MAG: hypothetical protein F6J90_38425 [Moorea sp. SIOASIH]|uniref:hypothetical protein n=1 Tax=Moorena sp. SIOASIH TaxID=2607817 RepID=UPI0013BDA285|nr:hypothetical protein [Moorena sp. SIOASIH]NEO41885.1 hypothetical protein [Moorena sp. SIOASIH]